MLNIKLWKLHIIISEFIQNRWHTLLSGLHWLLRPLTMLLACTSNHYMIKIVRKSVKQRTGLGCFDLQVIENIQQNDFFNTMVASWAKTGMSQFILQTNVGSSDMTCVWSCFTCHVGSLCVQLSVIYFENWHKQP